MSNAKMVSIQSGVLCSDGLIVSDGEIRQMCHLDGLQFIALSKPESPDSPIVALPKEHALVMASLIIKRIIPMIRLDNEVVIEALTDASAALESIIDFHVDYEEGGDEGH